MSKENRNLKDNTVMDEESSNRELRGWSASFVMVLGILFSAFHFFAEAYGQAVGPMPAYQLNVVHLAFAMSLLFLLFSPAKKVRQSTISF